MASVNSSANTPLSVDDAFVGFEDNALLVDVLANDRGGSAKSLYSVSPASSLGAAVNMSDGKVFYSASSAQIYGLAAGETIQDTFTYTIQLGTGVLSSAQVIVTLTGTNDAPVVSGVVTGLATEDGAAVTLNGLANATDVDNGAVLSIVNVPASLPAGVSSSGSSFTLDPTDAAYQSLAAGQTTIVTVNYGVSDGTVTTAAAASWTVTGANDAPVVSGAVTGSAIEGGALVSLAALANASDPDNGAVLSVTGVGSLPAGVSYVSATKSFTLDPTDPAYSGLNTGQSQVVSVSYGVTDGTDTTPGSVSWTLAGVSNAQTADHLITFEDLANSTSYPAGYAGFNWAGSDASPFASWGGAVGPTPMSAGDWEQNGGDKEAFNAFLAKKMTITRTDGTDFDLVSLEMADGWPRSTFRASDANEVDLLGWDDGVLVYSQHVTLSDTDMTNYVLNFSSIDTFEIVITGGTAWAPRGLGLYVIDNVVAHY